MHNINHLAPFYNFYKIPFLSVSRRAGYRYSIFKLFIQLIPELNCDYDADFPFNPKHIPKVSQRRIRKACYQSFALYKKSFKPKRMPRIRIIKDELRGLKQDESMQGFHDCMVFFAKSLSLEFMLLPEPEQITVGFQRI